MKKRFLVFCLLSAAALAAVWWNAGRAVPLDEPPELTVACGGKTAAVHGPGSGIWWESPSIAFNGDGDVPTDPAVRDQLERFQGGPGEVLTLSWEVPPTQLSVSLYQDVPVGSGCLELYNGQPESGQVEVTLPGSCGGVYSVWASWELGSQGRGGYERGFLVEGPAS